MEYVWIPKDALGRELKVGDTVAYIQGGNGYSKREIMLAHVLGFKEGTHRVQIERSGQKSCVVADNLIITTDTTCS